MSITKEDLECLRKRQHEQARIIAELRFRIGNEMVTKDRFMELKAVLCDLIADQLYINDEMVGKFLERVREI